MAHFAEYLHMIGGRFRMGTIWMTPTTAYTEYGKRNSFPWILDHLDDSMQLREISDACSGNLAGQHVRVTMWSIQYKFGEYQEEYQEYQDESSESLEISDRNE